MALAQMASLVDQSTVLTQSCMLEIDLGVFRKMEQNHQNTHQTKKHKLVISSYKHIKYLPFVKLLRETDCIMYDSRKMSPEKVCLDLKFSYLCFNSQSYLQESASSSFLIEAAWLEICPSAII